MSYRRIFGFSFEDNAPSRRPLTTITKRAHVHEKQGMRNRPSGLFLGSVLALLNCWALAAEEPPAGTSQAPKPSHENLKPRQSYASLLPYDAILLIEAELHWR